MRLYLKSLKSSSWLFLEPMVLILQATKSLPRIYFQSFMWDCRLKMWFHSLRAMGLSLVRGRCASLCLECWFIECLWQSSLLHRKVWYPMVLPVHRQLCSPRALRREVICNWFFLMLPAFNEMCSICRDKKKENCLSAGFACMTNLSVEDVPEFPILLGELSLVLFSYIAS